MLGDQKEEAIRRQSPKGVGPETRCTVQNEEPETRLRCPGATSVEVTTALPSVCTVVVPSASASRALTDLPRALSLQPDSQRQVV